MRINAHWEEQTFRLPSLPEGLLWHLACASRGICCPAGQETPLLVPTQFTLGPRETAVLIGFSRGCQRDGSSDTPFT